MNRTVQAEIFVALSAAFWGLFWIPLRALEQHGLAPAWTTLSQFIGPIICMLPFAIYRVVKGKPLGLNQVFSGVMIGSAFALYATSLLLTDVVRALILFYVMPAWGTLVEVGLMGRTFTRWRAIALTLSLCGLLVIVGIGSGWNLSETLSFNLGDCMSLAAGIAFTFGVMRVRQSPQISVFEQTFAFFIFGGLAALVLAYLPFFDLGQPPDLSTTIKVTPWVMLLSAFYLIPVMWGMYWGSRYVDPGRLGLLLQLEMVLGIISAAWLTNEIFGWREAIGTALVLSAGFVEVFGNRYGGNPVIDPPPKS